MTFFSFWWFLRKLILWILCIFLRPPVPPSGPWSGDAAIGRWDQVLPDSHVSAIHMAVLRTKEVLWFSGGRGYVNRQPAEEKSWVWKIKDIGISGPINPPVETDLVTVQLFCAGHSFLRDGRLLVVGGSDPDGTGIRDVNIYNPQDKSWTPVALLGRPRWYPTNVTLPDGRVTAFSGRGDLTVHEVYELGQPWKNLNMNRTLPIYAGLHLLPNGKLFYSGTYWGDEANIPDANTAILTPDNPNWTPDGAGVTSGTWQSVTGPNNTERKEGMSILLPPAEDGRVMVVGGNGTGTQNSSYNSVEIIELLSPNPFWKTIHPMAFRRSNVNVVILPDSKVLVCGGGSHRRGTPVLECELFDTSVSYMDPNVNPWTTVASMNYRRQYHSTCVLLPDGRILTGGNDTGSRVMQLEAYRPPYWFRGPRPRIWHSPKMVHIGQEFTVDTLDARYVESVVLVRPMATTHHTDSEQRLLNLVKLRRGRCSIRVRAPANHRLAPPGYYMLFLVNTEGVPSVAEFIEIH